MTGVAMDGGQSPIGQWSLEGWKRLGLVGLAVIVLAIPLYALKQSRARATAGAAAVAAPEFVGRERCAECHRKADEAWRGSDHDWAMAEPTEATVRGDFDDAIFEHRDVVSRFYRKDGGYWVHTAGPGGEPGDYEVAYTFGFEPLQQYLVRFPGGRLQALSIAWDTERRRWFHLYPDQEIPPDDWLYWTRGAQNWNGMCAECHSTDLHKNYDAETDSYATTWFEIDVGCEACHGPGSRHVAWAEMPPMARPPLTNDGLVVATSGLAAREQVELCAPCHSRRSELGDYDHMRAELMDALLPSLLREGLYHADGQILDEVYVYGSFLQSKMYRNGVRCSDCHDVHSLKLVRDGNELCLQCHRADAYDVYEHHFHKQEYQGRPSDGARCVKCHMVEQPYMVIDWRADHSFRVPRPDLTRQIGTPNACTQGGCHDDKPLDWSLEAYRRWYGEARKPHYGTILAAGRRGAPEAQPDLIRLAGNVLYPAIVRATALSLLEGYPGQGSERALESALADDDPLVRHTAVDSLRVTVPERLVTLVAPLLFDPVRVVRMEAAATLSAVPRERLEPYQQEALDKALADYESAMKGALDFASSGLNLGILYANLGQPQLAERYYRKALAVDDLFYPAKMNLALLTYQQGSVAEAERLYREVVDAYPDAADAAYSLGLLLVELGRPGEALELLQRAARAAPEWSRVRLNLGLLLQQLGRTSEAEVELRQAVALEPDGFDQLYALADHCVRRGRLEEALTLAEQLAAEFPEQRAGHEMKAWIEQQLSRRP